MQTPKSENGQRSAMETAILNHFTEYTAQQHAEYLEKLFLNALESTEVSSYSGLHLNACYYHLLQLRDFLVQLEDAALVELPGLDAEIMVDTAH